MEKEIQQIYIGALHARQSAYAPYSKFSVGAALRNKQGTVYLGANVENASYGLTVCAERNAVMAAVISGDFDWDMIGIVSSGQAPPCGMCLQVLAEFTKDIPIYLFSPDSVEPYKLVALSDLLPLGFTKDLLLSR